MRIRSIKPEFWADEVIGSWPFVTRLAYIALWNEADDQGRLRCNMQYLRCKLFPYDSDLNFAEVLRPIIESQKLIVYEASGQRYGFLTKFLDHQAVNRPTPSRLPGPNGEKPATLQDVLTEDSRRIHGELTEGSRQEGNGREGKGRECTRKQKGTAQGADRKWKFGIMPASKITEAEYNNMSLDEKTRWYRLLESEKPVMNELLFKLMADVKSEQLKSQSETA